MIVEAFVPQQYCVGCDKPGEYYLNGFSEYNRLWLETNGQDGLQASTGGDDYLSSGSIFLNGFTKSLKVEPGRSEYKYTITSGEYIILNSSGQNITNNYTSANKTIFYFKKDPQKVTKNRS